MIQSIHQGAQKLGSSLGEIADILESFYEEEQILFQAGVDLNYQEQQVIGMKMINDAILQNI